MFNEIRSLIDERQFAKVRQLLLGEEPADIASLFEQFPPEDFLVMFRLLPKELAAECFVEMGTEEQQILIEAMTDAELSGIVDELFLDDTVDIVEEMPANVVRRIMRNTTAENRAMINQLLKYPKDSAGTIMTTEFVELKAHMKVAEAFARIKEAGVDKETIYTCYVTDAGRHLIGVLTVKDMLLAGEGSVIGDLMETSIISAVTTADKEDVVRLFDRYDFLAIPVVDNENRLVGIVTIDDAMDVLTEEDTEDIQIMAAISPTDKPYMKTGVIETWLNRIPWLLILMISATFTGLVISGFEDKLQAIPVLMAYIPMLMDTAGNSGSQASVSVIRGISLGEVEFSDFFRVIWKESRVAVLCSVVLSAANFAKLMLFDRLILGNSGITILVAAVVSITLAMTIIMAKIVGCSLPIVAKKIGLDPAVMASPFITTIVDVLSLLVYFKIATALLPL